MKEIILTTKGINVNISLTLNMIQKDKSEEKQEKTAKNGMFTYKKRAYFFIRSLTLNLKIFIFRREKKL